MCALAISRVLSSADTAFGSAVMAPRSAAMAHIIHVHIIPVHIKSETSKRGLPSQHLDYHFTIEVLICFLATCHVASLCDPATLMPNRSTKHSVMSTDNLL